MKLGGCDIVLNVHTQTEGISDDTKVSFYEKLEHIFCQFLKYHIKILLDILYC
jgi:hypothetical protein